MKFIPLSSVKNLLASNKQKCLFINGYFIGKLNKDKNFVLIDDIGEHLADIIYLSSPEQLTEILMLLENSEATHRLELLEFAYISLSEQELNQFGRVFIKYNQLRQLDIIECKPICPIIDILAANMPEQPNLTHLQLSVENELIESMTGSITAAMNFNYEAMLLFRGTAKTVAIFQGIANIINDAKFLKTLQLCLTMQDPATLCSKLEPCSDHNHNQDKSVDINLPEIIDYIPTNKVGSETRNHLNIIFNSIKKCKNLTRIELLCHNFFYNWNFKIGKIVDRNKSKSENLYRDLNFKNELMQTANKNQTTNWRIFYEKSKAMLQWNRRFQHQDSSASTFILNNENLDEYQYLWAKFCISVVISGGKLLEIFPGIQLDVYYHICAYLRHVYALLMNVPRSIIFGLPRNSTLETTIDKKYRFREYYDDLEEIFVTLINSKLNANYHVFKEIRDGYAHTLHGRILIHSDNRIFYSELIFPLPKQNFNTRDKNTRKLKIVHTYPKYINQIFKDYYSIFSDIKKSRKKTTKNLLSVLVLSWATSQACPSFRGSASIVENNIVYSLLGFIGFGLARYNHIIPIDIVNIFEPDPLKAAVSLLQFFEFFSANDCLTYNTDLIKYFKYSVTLLENKNDNSFIDDLIFEINELILQDLKTTQPHYLIAQFAYLLTQTMNQLAQGKQCKSFKPGFFSTDSSFQTTMPQSANLNEALALLQEMHDDIIEVDFETKFPDPIKFHSDSFEPPSSCLSCSIL